MHPLVLCLLQERVDPAAIATHEAKGAKVAQDARRESRDAGNRFELRSEDAFVSVREV